MSYIPHVSSTNDWAKHFADMAASSGKRQAFYIVGKTHADKLKVNNITLVSNTEQAINRAQADLDRLVDTPKRKRKSTKYHSSFKKRRVNNYAS